MFPIADNQSALPRSQDVEGLWSTPLAGRDRHAVAKAFAVDPELRVELDAILRELDNTARGALVREFAAVLVGPPVPATPAGAVLPALARCIDAAEEPLL